MPMAHAPGESAVAVAGYLSDIRVWGPTMKTAARRWLRNFSEPEHPFAAALLESFIYFPATFVDRLFVAAFDALAPEVASGVDDYSITQRVWRDFFDDLLVTHPTGEMPNVTDSGYAFDRRARQMLQIPQEHVLEPEGVIELLARGRTCPVAFVDDFVGSGDQFVKTWQRIYRTAQGDHSFHSLAAAGAGPFFYCPLICTTRGLEVLERSCPRLLVRPAHLLPPEYSAAHPKSLVWPDSLRDGAVEFVESASARAGVPGNQLWGYADLGLLVAFEHGVPDATLPIMWWEEDGWVPLVKLR